MLLTHRGPALKRHSVRMQSRIVTKISAPPSSLQLFESVSGDLRVRPRRLHDKSKSRTPRCCFSGIGHAQAENSFQEPFDMPETVYRSWLDMQAFQQEVLRVVLLDARLRRITAVDVTKGTVNESLAHPREIFRPAIIHSATLWSL